MQSNVRNTDAIREKRWPILGAAIGFLLFWVLASASFAQSSVQTANAPFESENAIIQTLEPELQPIQELLGWYVRARACGLWTPALDQAYFARRRAVVQSTEADFSTLKALRFLAVTDVERNLRQLTPRAYRLWCRDQASGLLAYFDDSRILSRPAVQG